MVYYTSSVPKWCKNSLKLQSAVEKGSTFSPPGCKSTSIHLCQKGALSPLVGCKSTSLVPKGSPSHSPIHCSQPK